MTITAFLTILTVLTSLMAFNNHELFAKLLHSPYAERHRKEYYRLITSGFIHADWMHLFVNMFVLYQFGSIVEHYYLAGFGMWGRMVFLLMYLGAIVVGDIPTLLKYGQNPNYRAIGASGGVSGVMLAYTVFAPWQKIYIYGLIGIPSILAAVLYLAYSSWAARQNRDNIGHDAHFFGAVFGFLFTIMINPRFMNHFLENFMRGLPQ